MSNVPTSPPRPSALVVGGGPAGLVAAETLARAGAAVTLVEAMPTVGRKFLIAGRGGLNLTHSEPLDRFLDRYAGDGAAAIRRAVTAFAPADLVAFAEGLGQETFVGSSGRVFPRAMKASPMLRAWLRRLDGLGVTIRTRTRFLRLVAGGAEVAGPDGAPERIAAGAVVLALGGSTWAKLGSDGAWVAGLSAEGLPIRPLRPANGGLAIGWSALLREKFAGTPLKRVGLSFGRRTSVGEAVVTSEGLEGGIVYALFADVREAIERDGRAEIRLDLRPDLTLPQLTERLARPRGSNSLSNFLRKSAHMAPVAVALAREPRGGALPEAPEDLARAIKSAPLVATGVARPDRAISSAGGVDLAALTDDLEWRARPGVFLAGEMLDWEAPTGGYLLQAAFATGRLAGLGAARRLGLDDPPARPSAP